MTTQNADYMHQVAQHYEDMVQNYSSLEQENQVLKNDLEIERRTSDRLSRELEIARTERDRYQTEGKNLRVSLNNVGHLIIQALDEAGAMPKARPLEIAKQDNGQYNPVPKFFQQGPRSEEEVTDQ